MTVVVVVPWRDKGCEWRQRAKIHVQAHYARGHPGGQWVEGSCGGPWSKGRAVADALTRTAADVLVVTDADVLIAPEALHEAVSATESGGWAVPHLKVHRLSQRATEAHYAGDLIRDWDRQPYRGVVGGGLVVVRRDVYERVPIDPRFEGWGGEDVAWGWALNAVAGPAWRGEEPLTHLWHPSDRIGHVGSPESARLVARWKLAARRGGVTLEALLDEARGSLAVPASLPSLPVLPALPA